MSETKSNKRKSTSSENQLSQSNPDTKAPELSFQEIAFEKNNIYRSVMGALQTKDLSYIVEYLKGNCRILSIRDLFIQHMKHLCYNVINHYYHDGFDELKKLYYVIKSTGKIHELQLELCDFYYISEPGVLYWYAEMHPFSTNDINEEIIKYNTTSQPTIDIYVPNKLNFYKALRVYNLKNFFNTKLQDFPLTKNINDIIIGYM